MPRIEIIETEYYPFLDVRENPSPLASKAFEVDTKTLARWKRYEKTFKKWQKEMEDLDNEHNS